MKYTLKVCKEIHEEIYKENQQATLHKKYLRKSNRKIYEENLQEKSTRISTTKVYKQNLQGDPQEWSITKSTRKFYKEICKRIYKKRPQGNIQANL